MKYMMLKKPEQDALLAELENMPEILSATFGRLSSTEAATSGPEETFSPVEHCWHLADLEREGFSIRIHRLMSEPNPSLPDFEGDKVARERCYKTRSLAAGITAFRDARRDNLAALRDVDPEQWTRQGTQEGLGSISLCDIPTMMAEHDEAHRREIDAWFVAKNQ